MLPQQYCLRWKYHHSNLQTMFSQLLDRGCFCDVTLACEGQLIRAHRVVLCACSTFFDTVLTNYANDRDPIIIMKDVTFADVKCLIEFMYKGEINVEHTNLASLLKTADDLKIKGLAEVSWREDENDLPPPVPIPPECLSPLGGAGGRLHENIHNHQHSSSSTTTTATNNETTTEQQQRNSSRPPSPVLSNRGRGHQRMPILTPIPSALNPIITESHHHQQQQQQQQQQHFVTKRKRGRPPLDETYDVFNVPKMPTLEPAPTVEGNKYHPNNSLYVTHKTHSSFHHSNHHNSKQQHQQQLQHNHNKSQQSTKQLHQQDLHLQQQQQQHQQQYQHFNPQIPRPIVEKKEIEEIETNQIVQPDPEWITGNMGANVGDCESIQSEASIEAMHDLSTTQQQQHGTQKERRRTEDSSTKETTPNIEQEFYEKEFCESSNLHHDHHHHSKMTSNNYKNQTSSIPLAVEIIEEKKEPIEEVQQDQLDEQLSFPPSTETAAAPPPPPRPVPLPLAPPPPPPLSASSSSSSSSSSVPPDDSDIGLENNAAPNSDDHECYEAIDCKLTKEELAQWNDVVKMDAYLAKGRRPQFWEEPFTRKVLDAIKNKKLEMKKAAKILGVSYGTLYGRYREVYGCLKHPYRGNQRFDVAWSSDKRLSLEVRKVHPKDLSELWMRPQI